MNIVKSLHSSLLHKTFSYREKHYFTVSVLWGFNLQTGEPVLEQELWQTIGDQLGKNEMFDAGMPKVNAELLVQGSCFGANGAAVSANRVFVSFGSISKELMVFGDRHWIKGLGIGLGVSAPKTFTEMPVSYANAFGGKDHAPNPVGKGIDEIDVEGELLIPLPNIENAVELIGSPNDKPRPAGFSRTDMMCEQRMKNAGTYDQNYLETRMPGFPDDLNYNYFNDAVQDQWVDGFFNGDEQYEIHNMNPSHPIIKGQIPSVYGRIFVNHEVNGELQFKEIPTNLDTVTLFPGAEIGVMIHRGTLQVSKDDATDIKQILIANENISDNKKTDSHYQNALAQRTDPKESFKYLLYTAPLLPEGLTCGFKAMQESGDFPLELLANQNLKNFSDTKQSELNQNIEQQLKDSGLEQSQIDEMLKKMSLGSVDGNESNEEAQHIKTLTEKVLPGASAGSKNIDITKLNLKAIDELNAYMEALQKQKKEEAKIQLEEQIDKLKKLDPEGESSAQVKQLEVVLTTMVLPPMLPRISVSEINSQLKDQQLEIDKQLVVMQSMGLPDEQLRGINEAMDPKKLKIQLHESVDKMMDSYRIGAHFLPQSRSPHEGKEVDIRQMLIAAYKANGETAYGDYAFVDLSDLDLSGIDLSGSYLEYANLTNTNLTNANLNKVILSNAVVTNTNFTNTTLTDANLGSVSFDGATFDNADLTGAMLGKSNIRNSQFSQCKMANKLDMFLDTHFDNSSFIKCDLHKNAFIDSDISGCNFSQSDLSETSFVNPIMRLTIFSGANLSGVNFVKADAEGAKFNSAIMKNVRFVGESSLPKSDFSSADINQANLRDCNLENAIFSDADLHKSDFGGSNLKNASFVNARAVEAQFMKADLTFANMKSIDLMEGSMQKAVISGADFSNANLYSVNFLGCTVGETDFSGAYLENTIFKDWRP